MAAIPPTNLRSSFKPSLRVLKILRSSSSKQNARTTLAPVRFSRVESKTLSSFSCVFLYKGIHANITAYTTIASATIAIANTPIEAGSIKYAVSIAPNTINGERKNKRKARFTPD